VELLHAKSVDSNCHDSFFRGNIGAPLLDGSPARNSGREPRAAMRKWERAAWGFRESCFGNVSARLKKYIKMLINKSALFTAKYAKNAKPESFLGQMYAPRCNFTSVQICANLRNLWIQIAKAC